MAMTHLEQVARRCPGAHRTTDGWRACCPVHEGSNPESLHLTEQAGRIVAYCHSHQCPQEAIRHLLGLDPPTGTPESSYTTYDYQDASGHLLFQVVRIPGPTKRFFQRRPDPSTPGRWVNDLRGITTVLYHLPELAPAITAGTTIYLPEGEKDVETLRAHGLVATCNPGGAGKWQARYGPALAHADVVVLPDNDAVGVQHAQSVTALLGPWVTSLRVVTLPGLPPKGDVSDWLGPLGHTREEFLQVCGNAISGACASFAREGELQARAPVDVFSGPWSRAPENTSSGAPARGAPPWQAQLMVNKNGDPTMNYGNIGLLLAHHPHWAGAWWWDSIRSVPMYQASPLTEELLGEVAQWFCITTRMALTTTKPLRDCILVECHRHPRDLLAEGLRALPAWDGVSRLPHWLHDVAETRNDAYGQAVARILPLSLVARALDPGCLYRWVVILEGAENTGKSRLVRALAGPEWYVELTTSLENKESHMTIQGAWVAELAELDSLSRTEESRLKAFITHRDDSWVPKYSNLRVTVPRRTVLVGTTNDHAYLKGQTGNTRFLPIQTGAIDVALFDAMREQLFAEALSVYQAHPLTWWPLPEDAMVDAVRAREDRRVLNVYENPLREWLDSKRFRETYFRDNEPVQFVAHETSWQEIAQYFLKMERPEQWKDYGLQRQIIAALKSLGWDHTTHRRNGRPQKLWVLPS
jgi:hypothetical protein